MKNEKLISPGEFVMVHNLQTFQPTQSADLYRAIKDPENEKLFALALDENNQLLGVELLAFGPLPAGKIPPKEIFRDCILLNAKKIALVKYQPVHAGTTGDADKDLAKRLIAAGDAVGIEIKYYIILGDKNWSAIAVDSVYRNQPIYTTGEIVLKEAEAAAGMVSRVINPAMVIDTPWSAVDVARDIFNRESRSTMTFLMDHHNHIVSVKSLTNPAPAAILKECVLAGVSGFILCTAFPLAVSVAAEIVSAAEAFDLTLIDAITISPADASFKSFRKAGWLPSRRGTYIQTTKPLVQELQEQPSATAE